MVLANIYFQCSCQNSFLKPITFAASVLVVCGIAVIVSAQSAQLSTDTGKNTTDAKQQYEFSLKYYNGEGVQKDLAKGAEWFRKTADQGNAEAQCFLGICYAKGDGVPKDLSEAKEWFQKAADQGHEDAQKEILKINKKLSKE